MGTSETFIHDSELPSELCDDPECYEHGRTQRDPDPLDDLVPQWVLDLVLDRVRCGFMEQADG